MAEQEEVLKLISDLLLVEADAVPVHVGPQARRGLSRLKTAIEDSDLETVIRSSTNESLPLPAGHLTDPEIRYFNLYRESYTVEHIHAPETNRKLSATRSGGGRFRAAANQHMVAMRFLGSFRPRSQQDLEKELENVLSWSSFNVNRVAQLSNRQPLLMVGLAALNHFSLLTNLNISLESAANFLKAVEHHYMPNPYHNSTHAADVTQALLCILTQDELDQRFTDLELFAMVLAAILHDVAHPGLSNSFLSRTQDEQALMYNDQSSNEALSLSIGFKILQAPECNMFINMSREDYFYVRRLVTEIILATDMAGHSKMLSQARADLQSPSFWDGPDAEGRLLAMKTIMHTADISNVCRPPVMAGMWTRAVYEEFFRQGDAEKEMGLEKVFLGFVVAPTWDLLKEIAPTSYVTARGQLAQNQALWAELAEMNDPTAVLQDPTRTPELVHVSPLASPFHNPARNSWGNADMLLLLLNDEKNCIIGQGLTIISQRGNGIAEGQPIRDNDSIDQ